MIERTFPATDAMLPEAIAYVEAFLEQEECPMKAMMQITVCVEEMFVNVAHYAYAESNGDVTLTLACTDRMFSLTLTDHGKPFDPLAKEDPDITLAAEDRMIGGLGIFMVKKSMDEVSYERSNGQNIFTMKKKI